MSGSVVIASTVSEFGGALRVLSGVVVGGLVTWWVTTHAEDKRQAFAREQEERARERDEAKELAVARGVARVVDSYFRNWLTVLKKTTEAKLWWPEEYFWAELPPLEDRKLLASHLDSIAWRRVERAQSLLAATRISQKIASDRAAEGELPKMSDQDVENTKAIVEIIEKSQESLEAFAEVDRSQMGGTKS